MENADYMSATSILQCTIAADTTFVNALTILNVASNMFPLLPLGFHAIESRSLWEIAFLLSLDFPTLNLIAMFPATIVS